jgi:hypothetical protein
MDTLAAKIAPDRLYEYLVATKTHCVSLFRDVRLENRDETRVLRGTGTFVLLPGETRILLVTAAHCIPRTEQYAPLQLYAGVDDTVQLDVPLVEVLREEPYRGSDFAFFVADDIVSIAGGEKRPIEPAAGISEKARSGRRGV